MQAIIDSIIIVSISIEARIAVQRAWFIPGFGFLGGVFEVSIPLERRLTLIVCVNLYLLERVPQYDAESACCMIASPKRPARSAEPWGVRWMAVLVNSVEGTASHKSR